GRAALRLQHDIADVAHAAQVPLPAHDELALAELEEPPADVAVALPERHPDVADGDAEGGELLGVDDDLVLLLEPADGRHLAHAAYGLELVLEVEVLDAPELREVVGAGGVAERILVDPADARRVRPQRRLCSLGETTLDLREVLQHAATRPVHVGAVL